jgi:hypothetical protein
MKSEVYKRKVDKRDELLAGLLDPAARIKKRADELRRTACDFCTRVAMCIQADWDSRTCVWSCNRYIVFVTNLSFKH